MTTLFHADILLDDYTVLKGGYLGVRDDTISYIGQAKPAEAYDSVRTLQNHLLIPGLYNLHTHSPMTLLRGVGSDLPLDRWLHEAIFPVEAKLTDEDISVGARLAMLELLASGVVSFTDMYDNMHAIAHEVAAAGMKANLGRPAAILPGESPTEGDSRLQIATDFYKDWHNKENGRILVDFSIHAEYTITPELARKCGEVCKSHNAIMHLHLSETVKEHEGCKERRGGMTPTQWFDSLGVFENPTVAAHCVAVEPGDMDIMHAKGVTAVHNPTSNMKLASGFMPMADMLGRGMKLAIGTDGAASNNNLNLFEEMHLASIIHKGHTGDPTVLSPTQLLTMATVAGAETQGRKQCGALAVGNKADIVALSLDKPHLMPVHDVPALLVYAAQGSDVALTMVDGKVLYENGVYHTIDVDKVRYDLEKSITRLI